MSNINDIHALLDRSVLWLLGLFFVLMWFPRVTTIGGSPLGISALLLPIFVLYLFVKLPQPLPADNLAVHFYRIVFGALAFSIFWGFVALIGVEDPYRSGRFFQSSGQGLLLLVLVTRYLPRSDLLKLLRLSMWVCVLTSLIGVAAFWIPPLNGVMYQGTDRLYGFFKNPNQYGMIMAMAVVMSLSYLFYSSNKLLAAVSLLMSLAALAMSGSKTSLIIAAFLLLLMTIYYLLSAKLYLRIFFVLPMLVVIITMAGLPVLQLLNPRASAILTNYVSGEGSQKNSVYQRSFVWKKSLQTISEKPFFGQGPGQRVVIYEQNHTPSHNVVLDYGRTLGVPGMLSMIIIIFSAAFISLHTLYAIGFNQNRRRLDGSGRALIVGACFSIVSYSLSNQMSDSFGPSTSAFFWVLLAVVLRRDNILFGGAIRERRLEYKSGEVELFEGIEQEANTIQSKI